MLNRFRYAPVLIALCASLLVAACGGGGGDGDDEPGTTPEATVAAFDEQLLTAAVLRLEDLPSAGFVGGGYFNPSDQQVQGRSFSTEFSNGKLHVQSSVARYADVPTAQALYVSKRRLVSMYGNKEENYDIPGADEAVIYRINRPRGLLSWSISGEYVVLVQTTALDLASPDPLARDEENFQRWAATVLERVGQLQTDAANVTPLPDIAKTPKPTITFTSG